MQVVIAMQALGLVCFNFQAIVSCGRASETFVKISYRIAQFILDH